MDRGEAYEREPRPPRRHRRRGHGVLSWLVLILAAALVYVCIGSQPKADPDNAAGHSTILIAGTDKDGYRTDTLMLLSIDKNDRALRLLSIPRDTHVDAPYSVPKINSACGYAGGGKAGMAELMTQVTKLVGFKPDGYALVDLDAFVKIVDLMGGVDFDVPMDMRYSDPSQGLEIKLSAGKQHLDGAEAIQLVRFRSGYAMADITRTSVQRDFVKAAFTQWANVKSVVKLPVLMGILRKNVTTDLSAANMMWLCRAILSCGVSNMTTDILPGTPAYIGRGSYYVADPDAVAALMANYNPAS